MYDSIRKLLEQFEGQGMSSDRTQQITDTANYIEEQIVRGKPADLMFVCTHNSRRSQFAHVWASLSATHFDLSGVRCYSGGTEVTACNERTVASLKRFGFRVDTAAHAVDAKASENPNYLVSFADGASPIQCSSKLYSEPALNSFAAMMCCSDVDESCPVIPGAAIRVPWHYDDPKVADDTDAEQARYDERSLQIGRDMYHTMKLASQALGDQANKT